MDRDAAGIWRDYHGIKKKPRYHFWLKYLSRTNHYKHPLKSRAPCISVKNVNPCVWSRRINKVFVGVYTNIACCVTVFTFCQEVLWRKGLMICIYLFVYLPIYCMNSMVKLFPPPLCISWNADEFNDQEATNQSEATRLAALEIQKLVEEKENLARFLQQQVKNIVFIKKRLDWLYVIIILKLIRLSLLSDTLLNSLRHDYF